MTLESYWSSIVGDASGSALKEFRVIDSARNRSGVLSSKCDSHGGGTY